MNSCNINLLEKLIGLKLELAGRALDRLPSPVRPAARELGTQLMILLRDSLDQYLKNEKSSGGESAVRKINLE